ncbi:arginine deiminase-related protein [Aliikangiella sp. IMCC44359]|uniref:arginine deiminase-related protein n=1 Tax=Aliikangiella sp. IMCC44359 TaxID=3459125 RepID=UPI00403AD4A1
MTPYTQNHLTHSIVMVQPLDFGYNEQTSTDNEFQHKPTDISDKQIQLSALNEFNQMRQRLEDKGIEVIVLKKSHTQITLPDAVFPNNWFSTRQDGKLFIYPMKTLNRQAEVQIDELSQSLEEHGYLIKQTIDLRENTQPNEILEGTGSLVFHHQTGQAFAALSERCSKKLLLSFCQKYGYQSHMFNTASQQGIPIYHTNVAMSCGKHFVVIAKNIINQTETNRNVIKTLKDTFDDLIPISNEQMSQSFCGNIIQLQNTLGQPLIVMSESALKGFTHSQKKCLEKHGELIGCHIPTIEHIGGGSARCMIAENFLPQKNL